MKKRYVIYAILLFLVSVYTAQAKIVERSAKKAPEWIGVAKNDYVIVSAEDATLDGATQSCMRQIKQSIINAIAVNIASEQSTLQVEDNKNGSVTLDQRYESEVKVIAAKLPFITGISSSKGEVYWEKHYEKKQKRYYYIYHMKYPFSESERNSLIADFLHQDREQYDKYLALKAKFDTFTEIEYIERAITDLGQLSKYFFDDLRRDQVLALQRNYRSLYAALSLLPSEEDLGRNTFYLLLNGRKVVTSRRPILKSEYATNLTTKPLEEGLYEMRYNYENSLDDIENKIDLIYMFPNRALKHTFYFDIRKEKMAVIPFGEIELDVSRQPDSLKSGTRIDGWINLRSKYDTKFKVLAFNFTANGISTRIEGQLNTSFEGKANHRLSFTVDKAFTISDKRDALAQGFIELLNTETKETKQIRFALPYKIRSN